MKRLFLNSKLGLPYENEKENQREKVDEKRKTTNR